MKDTVKINLITFSSVSAILILIVIAYFNSIYGSFQFDDEQVILDNTNIRSASFFADISTWLNTTNRPLALLSFALNYLFSGLWTPAYHLTNIIIHCITAILTYFTIKILVQHFKPATSTKALLTVTFFSTAIFALHPLQTESVTYISQRMTSLSGLFFMASFFSYTYARVKTTKSIKKTVLFILAVLFLGLSLLSKQIGITLLPVLLIMELTVFKTKASVHAFVLTGLLLVIGLFLFFLENPTRDSEVIGRYSYLLTQSTVIFQYLQLIILPINQSVDHYILIIQSLNLQSALQITGILLILTAGIILIRRKKISGLGILFFFITLSIESSVFPIKDVMSEHRLYIPLFGVSLVFADLFLWAFLKKKKLSLGLGVAIIILLTITTIYRNQVWANPVKLWTDTIKKSPEKSRPWNNLGEALRKENRPVPAEKCFKQAINLDSRNANAYNNLGLIQMENGSYDLALFSFKNAISINPEFYQAFNNAGIVLMKTNHPKQAISSFKKSITIERDFVPAYFNLASLYEKYKKYDYAKKLYSHVLRISPCFSDAHYNLGNIYLKTKKPYLALKEYKKTLDCDRRHTDAMINIAGLLYQAGKKKEAEKRYKEVLIIDPGNKQADSNLQLIRKTNFPR